MPNELQFKVSAELKNILGRDLITSPNIAVLELVKNSYDAHATKVEITFGEDTLVIADNGKGMSLDDLKNKWLFVAYSAKSDGTEDESYRGRINRRFAGAKGIGRLSCDRLARYLKLETKSADGNPEILNVDWKAFEENQQKEFDRVIVQHETAEAAPLFPGGKETGTTMTFSGLRTHWNRDGIISLKKSLEKMINPFSEVEDFEIELIAPKEIEVDREAKEHETVNGIVENTISDVLRIKTTQIDVRLTKDVLITTLSDRGVVMYEIEEPNTFQYLKDANIGLFYMNHAAKTNFTKRMGIQPVRYGNVFLFRNGFRILPYGEYDDDSWGLNRRAQQGYNRFLGTRDLFGRVDVETDNVNDFKEVSSRDGGLIETPAYNELLSFFSKTHRRLERYVVGVLWGEGFLKRDYFRQAATAELIRKQLQEAEKDSETPDHIYKNIGSRVDFLQLVKSLVNEDNVTIKYYDSTLANIVNDVSAAEILQNQFFDDVRKIAEKTEDANLLEQIRTFEAQLDELKRQKEESDKKVEEARAAAEKERKKRIEEENKRKAAEEEVESRKKQNLFLQSISTLDKDRIIKYHHDIRLHALTVQNALSNISKQITADSPDIEKLKKNIGLISRCNDRIISIAQFATKANFNSTGDIIEEDLVAFVQDYLTEVLPPFYGSDIKITCDSNGCSKILKFKPIEIGLIIDNFLSNSLKAGASIFAASFSRQGEKLILDVCDDGNGLSSKIHNPSTIFEMGITTTNGSGLGLYNAAQFVQKELHGSIEVISDFVFSSTRKGFKIRITL